MNIYTYIADDNKLINFDLMKKKEIIKKMDSHRNIDAYINSNLYLYFSQNN